VPRDDDRERGENEPLVSTVAAAVLASEGPKAD
jgi:hypothetical protein